MNPIRQELRAVFITDDGLEFIDATKADLHQHTLTIKTILEDLVDVYWRETHPAEVAKELVKHGYTITKRAAE